MAARNGLLYVPLWKEIFPARLESLDDSLTVLFLIRSVLVKTHSEIIVDLTHYPVLQEVDDLYVD